MKVKKIKLSLMQRTWTSEFDEDKKSEGNYVVHTSGEFDVEKIIENSVGGVTDENYEEFLEAVLKQAVDDMKGNVNSTAVDSVGLWVETDTGVYENAMYMSVLDDMEKYGQEDVNSLYELYKMTVPEETEEDD